MARRSNMDAEHHSKIVDKLMQYRGKIPKYGQGSAHDIAKGMREHIDFLILEIEWFARCYELELIR
jgi:hypothetical protein